MLHGSGKEIYRAVVNKRPDLARRIILTSGGGTDEEIVRFAKETGNQMVLIPYTMEQIEKAIAKVMGK